MLSHIKRLIESVIRNIGGAIGKKIRLLYYKKKFKSCGVNVVIEEGVYFENTSSISLGSNIWIDKNVILIGGAFDSKSRKHYVKGKKRIEFGELIISDNVHIAAFSLIQAHGGVRIGKNVTIASGSKVYSLSHHYKNLNDKTDNKRYLFSTMANIEDQFLIVGNVEIGDNAAVGLNSVVLPGSVIPKGTWLGVSSYLNGNELLQPNTVYSSHKKRNE